MDPWTGSGAGILAQTQIRLKGAAHLRRLFLYNFAS